MEKFQLLKASRSGFDLFYICSLILITARRSVVFSPMIFNEPVRGIMFTCYRSFTAWLKITCYLMQTSLFTSCKVTLNSLVIANRLLARYKKLPATRLRYATLQVVEITCYTLYETSFYSCILFNDFKTLSQNRSYCHDPDKS